MRHEQLRGGGHGVPGELTVSLERAPTEEVRALVTELEAILSAEYPPEQRHGLSLEAIFQPRVRFFVARREGRAVGCGGVALLDDFAEVKRMYARERGSGVADAILRRLEEEARAAGLVVLRLETGTRQQAAVRFYERVGFRARGAFGEYATMPPEKVAGSLFYEKLLDSPRG